MAKRALAKRRVVQSTVTDRSSDGATRKRAQTPSRRQTAFERRRVTENTQTPEPIGTREKILDAAKQHFADFGLQHASVRAITRLAGVNSALIRYHFGSKRALYEEVVHTISKRLIEVRMVSLSQLREHYGSRPVPVENLLRSYAEPLFPRSCDDLSQDAAIYLRFFGRMYTEPSDELRGIIQSQFTELQKSYIGELARSIPNVPLNTIVFRFGLMIGSLTFLGSKIGVVRILSNGNIDESDTEFTLSEFVSAYSELFHTP